MGATFPPNRSTFRWGRNDTMGKSHPLLVGDGMRSAGSTMALVLAQQYEDTCNGCVSFPYVFSKKIIFFH